MEIALNVDYEDISARPEAVENAELTSEIPGALIVNVHANYIIKKEEQFVDGVFPHFDQMRAHFEAAERFGATRILDPKELVALYPPPSRRPDFGDEWKLLKKAWSLHSRSRDNLRDKELMRANTSYYRDDPLRDTGDWIWRFSTQLGGPKYNSLFLAVIREIQPILSAESFTKFLCHYKTTVSDRRKRYFSIFRDYFSAWAEFSQVHFAVSSDVPVNAGHTATTTGFNSVKMFYGNAFEILASSVDILAYMNNMIEGREWSAFKTIDVSTYLKSDKARRFDAFSSCQTFVDLTREHDNQVRNASHHGEFFFSSERSVVSYALGKGGTGNEKELSYAEYLARCSAIFLEVVALLRVELTVCEVKGVPFPV